MDAETIRYSRAIIKNIPLIIFVGLLTGILSYVLQIQRPENYTAEAKIFIGNVIFTPNPNLEQINLGQKLTSTYAELLRSYDLFVLTIAQLGLDILPENLEKQVGTYIIEDTMIVAVFATYDDPQIAADIANALAENLIVTSPTNLTEEQQQQLEVQNTQINELQDQISVINERAVELLGQINEAEAENDEDRVEMLTVRYSQLVDQLNSARATLAQMSELYLSLYERPNRLEIFERARPPLEPSGLSALIVGEFGVIAGGIIGVAIALFFEFVNQIIRTAEEAKYILNLPILGSIHRIKNIKTYTDYTLISPDLATHIMEDFRKVYINLLHQDMRTTDNNQDGFSKSNYIISSAKNDDGRSLFVTNLAILLGLSGSKVLLVDGDLVNPSLHKIFNLQNKDGLMSLIDISSKHPNIFNDEKTVEGEGIITLISKYIQQHKRYKNLDIIVAGAEGDFDKDSSFNWHGLKFWINEIMRNLKYDYILWDTSAALTKVDAQNLAALVDAEVIMLVRAGDTQYDEALQVKRSFEQVSVEISGIVINHVG